ncbi:hypothetical protein CBS101457_005329 [Exobasidium rhododendri]|nr:hypothetical protein CBS101457_005329 [Exobasidium rhododendri]
MSSFYDQTRFTVPSGAPPLRPPNASQEVEQSAAETFRWDPPPGCTESEDALKNLKVEKAFNTSAPGLGPSQNRRTVKNPQTALADRAGNRGPAQSHMPNSSALTAESRFETDGRRPIPAGKQPLGNRSVAEHLDPSKSAPYNPQCRTTKKSPLAQSPLNVQSSSSVAASSPPQRSGPVQDNDTGGKTFSRNDDGVRPGQTCAGAKPAPASPQKRKSSPDQGCPPTKIKRVQSPANTAHTFDAGGPTITVPNSDPPVPPTPSEDEWAAKLLSLCTITLGKEHFPQAIQHHMMAWSVEWTRLQDKIKQQSTETETLRVRVTQAEKGYVEVKDKSLALHAQIAVWREKEARTQHMWTDHRRRYSLSFQAWNAEHVAVREDNRSIRVLLQDKDVGPVALQEQVSRMKFELAQIKEDNRACLNERDRMGEIDKRFCARGIELQEKEKQIVVLAKELEGKEELIKEIRNNSERAKSELEVAKEALQAESLEKAKLVEMLQLSEKEKAVYEALLAAEKERVKERDAALEKVEEENRELRKKNNELRTVTRKVQEKLEEEKVALQQRLHESNDKIDEKEKQSTKTAALESELTELKTFSSELATELAKQTDILTQTENDHAKKMAEIMEQVKVQLQKSEENDVFATQQASKIVKLEATVETLEKDAEKVKAEAQAGLQRKDDDLAELQVRLRESTQTLLEGEKKKCESEKSVLREQIAEKEKEAKETEKRLDGLQAKCTKESNERRDLFKKHEELNTVARKTREDLGKAKGENLKLEEKILSINEKLRVMTSTNGKLSDMETFTERYQKNELSEKELAVANTLIEQTEGRFKRRIAESEENATKIQTQTIALQEQIDKKSKQIEDQDILMRGLEEEIERLKEERKKASEETGQAVGRAPRRPSMRSRGSTATARSTRSKISSTGSKKKRDVDLAPMNSDDESGLDTQGSKKKKVLVHSSEDDGSLFDGDVSTTPN